MTNTEWAEMDRKRYGVTSMSLRKGEDEWTIFYAVWDWDTCTVVGERPWSEDREAIQWDADNLNG